MTKEEIFGLFSKFLKTNGLLWFSCIAICSDDAAALSWYEERIHSWGKRSCSSHNFTALHDAQRSFGSKKL
jgi:hypothetical protein